MFDDFFKIAIALVVVAGIASVVRKGSQGPAVINNTLTGFAADLRAASN